MRARLLTASLAASLLVGGVVSPVVAVDPIPGRPLPDEPPVAQLTDLATASLVVDLDGDGAREVVAVTALDELRGFASVQAWWVDANGSVTSSNQVRLRRSATFDDRVAIGNGIRIDDDGMTGVRLGEPAHLFTARRDGRDVVLVTGIGSNPELTRDCCLTIWEVTSDSRGEIDLRLAVETHRRAESVAVADLDGDGTDELLALELGEQLAEGAVTAVLLTWNGAAYQITRSGLLTDSDVPMILDAGDSDGVPGDDVLIADFRDDGSGQLVRLTLRDGALTRDGSAVDLPQGVAAARVLALPEGPAIMTGDGSFLEMLQWRRDEPAEVLFVQPGRNGVPLAVFGTDADTLVVVGSQVLDVSALQVFSASRDQWSIVGADIRAGVLASLVPGELPITSQTWTHASIVPGGFPGAPEAFVFSGMRFEPTASTSDGETYRVEPMALLPGRRIVGTAGPDASWTALSGAPSVASGLSERVAPVGNLAEAAVLELADTAAILEPEAHAGALEPTMLGVAPDPERPDQLIVGSQAVDFQIEAPPGSRVWWTAPGTVEETTVGPDGVARIRLLEAAGGEVAEGDRLTRRVWLVTPAGHAYQGSWVIRVFRQPPRLGIVDEVPFIDLDPMVVGLTLPGSTLTVNGQTARVEDDGTFATPINPGIVPTDFRIAVTDPVGNRTEQLITRVWPLDYRQLPWPPIVVFVLLTVAGLLYVWEPEVRPRRRPPQEEESTFEEIGG